MYVFRKSSLQTNQNQIQIFPKTDQGTDNTNQNGKRETLRWRIAYMKTKKALGGLLGMFGSFFAFSFFAGFLLPRSLVFFTDNLNHNSKKAENRSKSNQLQTKTLRSMRNPKKRIETQKRRKLTCCLLSLWFRPWISLLSWQDLLEKSSDP